MKAIPLLRQWLFPVSLIHCVSHSTWPWISLSISHPSFLIPPVGVIILKSFSSRWWLFKQTVPTCSFGQTSPHPKLKRPPICLYYMCVTDLQKPFMFIGFYISQPDVQLQPAISLFAACYSSLICSLIQLCGIQFKQRKTARCPPTWQENEQGHNRMARQVHLQSFRNTGSCACEQPRAAWRRRTLLSWKWAAGTLTLCILIQGLSENMDALWCGAEHLTNTTRNPLCMVLRLPFFEL